MNSHILSQPHTITSKETNNLLHRDSSYCFMWITFVISLCTIALVIYPYIVHFTSLLNFLPCITT